MLATATLDALSRPIGAPQPQYFDYVRLNSKISHLSDRGSPPVDALGGRLPPLPEVEFSLLSLRPGEPEHVSEAKCARCSRHSSLTSHSLPVWSEVRQGHVLPCFGIASLPLGRLDALNNENQRETQQ